MAYLETVYSSSTRGDTLRGPVVKELHALVKVTLTGTTLYFTEPPGASMSEGHFWQPRLKGVSELTYAFSSFVEPKQRWASLSFTLDNHDDQVTTWLSDYEWGNRTVDIYVGEGTDFTEYDHEFSGIIRFPDTYVRSMDSVTVYVSDRRLADETAMPPDTFQLTDYPNLETDAIGIAIPVVYGDFSSGQRCPAYCIDTTGNPDFQVADHAVDAISAVYAVTPTTVTDITATRVQSYDLPNGKFALDTYDPDAEKIEVLMKGREDGDGDLMENPADIIEDLLTTYGGISSGSLSSESFTSVQSSKSDYKLRRWIGEVTSEQAGGLSASGLVNMWPLVTDICNEVGIDVVVRNGSYSIFDRDIGTTIWDYTERDIAKESYRVEQDPEHLYCNVIEYRYKFSPTKERYMHGGWLPKPFTESPEEESLGATVFRKFYFNWIWEHEYVDKRIRELLCFFAGKPKTVHLELLHRGLHRYIGDHFDLAYDIYSDTQMQIRSMTKNFASGKTRIKALIYPVAFMPNIYTDLNDWTVGDGTFEADDSDRGNSGTTAIKCTSAGHIYIAVPSSMQNLALHDYEWTWKMKKAAEANVVKFLFVAATAAVDAAGYSLGFDADECVVLNETGVADLGKSAASEIAVGTYYNCKVTRSSAGVFTFYIDETAVVADSGDNPVTDTTTTTTGFLLFDMDENDLVSEVKMRRTSD